MCTIKLHGILAEQSVNSKAKKLDSAKNIMELVVAVEPDNLLHLTPIIYVSTLDCRFARFIKLTKM